MTDTMHTGSGLPSAIPAPGLDDMFEPFRPWVELGMKMQAEFLGLCGRRCGAWLEWPGKCAACTCVEDLTRAQSEYVARMQHDYARFIDAILRNALIEGDEKPDEGEAPPFRRGEPEPPHRQAA